MKVCVVQMEAVPGNIASNLERHFRLAELAISKKADLIVFPELSLTGYEPRLASSLALAPLDPRLAVFEEFARDHTVTLAVGLPTHTPAGLCISQMIFQPDQNRRLYSKRYIHADERAFFVCGRNLDPLDLNGVRVAFAICFEISVSRHARVAAKEGAQLYVASVAKSAQGLEQAEARLAEIARTYSMPVLMANFVGPCHDFEASGRSAAWSQDGELLGQLDRTGDGILVLDTASLTILTA